MSFKVLAITIESQGIASLREGACSYNIGTTASEYIQPLRLWMYLAVPVLFVPFTR
jgi:hypothetical protein